MLQFDAQSATGTYTDEKGAVVLRLRLEVEATGEAGPSPLLVQAAVESVGGGFERLRLELVPAAPARVGRVALECSAGPAAGGLLSPEAAVLALGESRAAGRRTAALADMLAGAPETLRLDAIGALLRHAGRALVVALGGFAQDFATVELDGRRLIVAFTPQRVITRALQYSIVFGLGTQAQPLLEGYGDLLAAGGRRVGEVSTGWNSWDYYQGAVTMGDVQAEMQALAASPLRGRARWICLDMGWETRWGDWHTNRHFPESLPETAARIRAGGFEPGIWLAPLQVSTYVPAARCARQRYCHDLAGEPLVGPGGYLLLDPTHPEGRQWLFDLCRELREAGFTLFKIDYLYRDYLNLLGPVHELNVGKAGVVRRFFEIIREAIGEDAHLISCGAQLPAACGLADSARISTDIHNFWGHVINSAIQIANAYWLNRRVWVNDPDFALIRCAETSGDCYLNPAYKSRPYAGGEDFWMAGPNAGLTELRTWLALVHLCGGSLFASDSIARLNEAGQALLARLFEKPGPPARPLDLLDSVPPRVWLSEQCLGLINYADQPAAIPVPDGLPPQGRDFWTDAPVDLGGSLEVEPHGSLLVTLS